MITRVSLNGVTFVISIPYFLLALYLIRKNGHLPWRLNHHVFVMFFLNTKNALGKKELVGV